MSLYRHALPQLKGGEFLTDGGLETTLIFHRGLALPCFAAFDLLKSEQGRRTLKDYYRPYLHTACEHRCGFILEAPTWRANPDWAYELGYDESALAEANRDAIALMQALRDEYQSARTPIVISGNIGPRGDGYAPERLMSADKARDYHALQISAFAQTDADMVTALTLCYVDEAVGIVLAARDAGLPVAIAFTVETDGRLPDGTTLQQAVERTDEATDHYTAYYLINCAHPTHFEQVLASSEPWCRRIRGLRANASRLSHAELDECEELDDGDPNELGQQYRALKTRLPTLNVLGGCCGTDDRHVAAIADSCLA